MKNFVQPGNVVTATAPYAVSSGGGALIGTMFGVATNDVASGADGEFQVTGVFDLAKATGAGTAIAEGAAAYWDDGAKLVTGVSAGNTLIGVGLKGVAAGDNDPLARVRLNGSFS